MLGKGLFRYVAWVCCFGTCSDIYVLCQPFHPLDNSKLGLRPVGMINTENSGNWDSYKVYLPQQWGRNAHVFVSETVRNGNKCKNMLFWQVIIFNTKTESTRQLCFAFSWACGWFSFLASWFLLERNLFISHPLYTPHSQAEISVQDYPLSAQS